MIKKYSTLLWVSGIYAAFAAASFILKIPVMMSISFWGLIILLIILSLKKSVLQTTTMEKTGVKETIIISIFAFLLILLCVLPMDLAPFWNGQIPMHRDQYEATADAFLDGHLYLDYEVDPKLLAMENPYDYEERLAQEVDYHYDHAYYNGHYYMYFGVVPVVVLFIPFKLVFGRTLVTFHATQFFVLMGIIAFFLLFYMISKKFFKTISLGTYILATSAICLITLGYCVQAPALYCTAISGGVCFALWAITLYFYGVFMAKKEWVGVVSCTLAALSGALAFGCRPTAALANLIAVPLAIYYAKHYEGKKKNLVRNFIIIAIPYIIVAALLMMYNYARFENPFEFGQAYQLTTYDQTSYGNFFSRLDPARDINGIFYNFFSLGEVTKEFPYINYGGFFIAYPLMWLIVPFLTHKEMYSEMKNDKTKLLVIFLLLVPLFITLVDLFWAPGLCERYRLDEYFIVGILAFVLIGYRLRTTNRAAEYSSVISILAVVSMLFAFLLFMRPCDANFASYLPEEAEKVKNIVTFGIF